MTAKENPTIIGEIPCTSPNCNHVAQVRERATGKKLKYLYCEKKCKVNQTAGPDFQKFIVDNMVPLGTLGGADVVVDDSLEFTGESTDTKTELNTEFWRPETKKTTVTEQEQSPEPKKSSITAVHVVCGLLLLAVIGGTAWYFLRPKPKDEAVKTKAAEA